MVYKEFGKTGIKLSSLGFGAMRFPEIFDDNGKFVSIDEEKSIPMMHKAFELGVNYIDTAPAYVHSKSEAMVGKALKGWRDKVYLSTKNGMDDASYDKWMKKLENSLKELDTDYIDFYHMWGIGLEAFKTKVDVKGGPIDAAFKAKEQGLIKHISFSFHDKPENMREIVDSGYFESVLMQYNLLDRANEENIAYCNEKGLGVVIMGPVAGGRLGEPSKEIQDMMNGKSKSTAECALRFVLANPGVNIALSGMSKMEEVIENAATASIEGPLTADELQKVAGSLSENKRLAELYCTGCDYCLPCPQEINISRAFRAMNYHKVYGLTSLAKTEYSHIVVHDKKKQADACVECGQCESKCPQKIEIIKQLKETHEALHAL